MRNGTHAVSAAEGLVIRAACKGTFDVTQERHRTRVVNAQNPFVETQAYDTTFFIFMLINNTLCMRNSINAVSAANALVISLAFKYTFEITLVLNRTRAVSAASALVISLIFKYTFEITLVLNRIHVASVASALSAGAT